jgi:hypothetical protein
LELGLALGLAARLESLLDVRVQAVCRWFLYSRLPA